MIAQQKDAEAVLATLWDVNDASTSRIMGDFYRVGSKTRPSAKPKPSARPSSPCSMDPLHSPLVAPVAVCRSSVRPRPQRRMSSLLLGPFVLIGNFQ